MEIYANKPVMHLLLARLLLICNCDAEKSTVPVIYEELAFEARKT
jgi:hypothetical protein